MTAERGIDAVAVITCGRVGFAETFRNLFDSINRFGIEVVMNQSPYWQQSITQATEEALTRGRKYLLYFDGDSVWTNEDLLKLYQLIDSDDKLDAICAVQADRNRDQPLAYNWLTEAGLRYDYTQPVTPIVHGHFGMTFIRATAFDRLPRIDKHGNPWPWFQSKPTNDGRWPHVGPGKLDPDTWFWVRFNEAGCRAVVANTTVVGHMDLVVRWQQGGKVVNQTLADFRKDGKPYGLRNPTQAELGIKDQGANDGLSEANTEEPVGAA